MKVSTITRFSCGKKCITAKIQKSSFRSEVSLDKVEVASEDDDNVDPFCKSEKKECIFQNGEKCFLETKHTVNW